MTDALVMPVAEDTEPWLHFNQLYCVSMFFCIDVETGDIFNQLSEWSIKSSRFQE